MSKGIGNSYCSSSPQSKHIWANCNLGANCLSSLKKGWKGILESKKIFHVIKMVTPQQPNYYPPPLLPQYETEAKRAIYEEKIKSKLEEAKRTNKWWLITSILYGILGVLFIVVNYYSGCSLQLSLLWGLLPLIPCFSHLYFYLTKREVRDLERCRSPVDAISFYKEQIKKILFKMLFIAIAGIIIIFSFFSFFQNLVTQNRFLLLLVIIGIIMFIAGLRIFYLQIKIKECQKYI